MISGKVFLAESRIFYNIIAKFCLNTSFVSLCSYLFLLFLLHLFQRGATKVLVGETPGLFLVVEQRLAEDEPVLSKDSQRGAEEQLKNSLGTRRNGYEMTVSKFWLETGEGFWGLEGCAAGLLSRRRAAAKTDSFQCRISCICYLYYVISFNSRDEIHVAGCFF